MRIGSGKGFVSNVLAFLATLISIGECPPPVRTVGIAEGGSAGANDYRNKYLPGA
jgi:hypothetical protein